ncbi:MAG: tetratricopeptide repeat protein [Gemmatimonadaceae bacterium]
MRRRAAAGGALVAALSACAFAPASAQVAVGDSLWKMGRTTEAAAAYERALQTDRYSVRANVLAARTLAWGSNTDSALVLLRNARVRVPDDPDVRYAEALYLSWGKHFEAAIVKYDSLLATNPDLDYVRVSRARTISWEGKLSDAEQAYRAALALPMKDASAIRDANIGLAQVTSWRGDLAGAAKRYTALIADDPTDPRALSGLASVRGWQGQPRAAVRLLERALKFDSTDAEMKASLVTERAAAATHTDVEVDWSDDSDGDQNVWSLASQGLPLTDHLTATTSVGVLAASDAVRHANRKLADVGLAATGDAFRANASVGARTLDPDTPGVPDRAVFTARVGASMQVAPTTNIGISATRIPFDEIASLVARDINLTSIDANADLAPWTHALVSLGAGTLGFSDGNRRTNFTIRASQRTPDRPWYGVFARSMGFAETIQGYFSPGHFFLYEAQGGWDHDSPTWPLSFGGGIGSQRVDTGRPWQVEYHVEGRVGRHWKDGNSLALTGGLSTSAASSAVGAFHYSTLGLVATIAW